MPKKLPGQMNLPLRDDARPGIRETVRDPDKAKAKVKQTRIPGIRRKGVILPDGRQ